MLRRLLIVIRLRWHAGSLTVHSTPAETYKQATSITGLLLAFVILAGYLFAYLKQDMPKRETRMTKTVRSFHTFQISHAIMIVSLIVLIILHPLPGSTVRSAVPRAETWIYLLPSLIIYIAERLWRFSRFASRTLQMCDACVLPSLRTDHSGHAAT